MPTFKGRQDDQVQVSNVETDLRNKKQVSDAVKRSNINHTHKRAIWAEVNSGKISPKYQKTIASIFSAEQTGSVYSGGNKGY